MREDTRQLAKTYQDAETEENQLRMRIGPNTEGLEVQREGGKAVESSFESASAMAESRISSEKYQRKSKESKYRAEKSVSSSSSTSSTSLKAIKQVESCSKME